MFRTRFTLVALGALSAVTLTLGGCSSNNSGSPYALTGASASARDRAQWTDQKGHYRPAWQADINRPVGYPAGQPQSATGE